MPPKTASSKKPTKIRKLRKRIRITQPKKSCEQLQREYEAQKLKPDINNKEYQTLLRCVSNADAKSLSSSKGEYNFLYPNKDDPNFNIKIAKKKEFFDTRYIGKTAEDYEHIEEVSEKLCNPTEFELNPHQMFVRNFMSFQTPYNGLLLFHGLGTGKTCSAISVCEEMRTYLQQMGITKRIIIIASPAVQENFKLQLFDERKLKEVDGLWNIKACTGNKFIQEVNPMNMKGLTRTRVIRQIKKLISQSYLFQGYMEFSNYIKRVLNKYVVDSDSKEEKDRKERKALVKEFSNRMLVIDEVHNIRLSKEGKVKASSENLGRLVSAAKNLKLLLLSATPMFDSYKEIVWILNLLNLNDRRFPIEVSEVFNKKGGFKTEKGDSVGKQLLIRKATGYISYVRGENPFTFPYRIWPHLARNDDSLFIKLADGIWKYPNVQVNGGKIIKPIELVDLVLNNIGSYQEKGYEKLIHFLKKKYPVLGKKTAGIPYTVLESPLQALNIVYPHKELDSGEDDEDVMNYIVGARGLARVMNYAPQTKREFKYKSKTLKEFGAIFSPSEIGKYSGKIAYICDKIRQSEGIVFIYSQYIDGGAVPIALALEEMGITRFGAAGSLFKQPPVAPIGVKQGKLAPRVAGKQFSPAKYIMITGQKSLTPDVKRELKAVTDKDNVNGEKVKVVIVSRAGSEGLDFQNIRQMHILDPWYNFNRFEQVIGRAVRNSSHCSLPFESRNVEIYLYGTLLSDPADEAIDLYIYRLAERKALKIAAVTRVLKETAVDCLLNREALNFSAEAIAATTFNMVKQRLSSGILIDYELGDKNKSAMCDFTRCEYKCNPTTELIGEDIDKDTYNETFIVMNLDKILQRIRSLFKEKYTYKKTELLSSITAIKHYPIDQIYTALTHLIDDENEFITDTLGRLGHLVNVGQYYMFQPVELSNKHISRYDRVHPVPYKRKSLNFVLAPLPPRLSVGLKGVLSKLHNSLLLLSNPSHISGMQNRNWATACAWTIDNLVTYNKPSEYSADEFRQQLLTLAMHHTIDILNYSEKIFLLNGNPDAMQTPQAKSLSPYIDSYFSKFTVKAAKHMGMLLTNFSSKSYYTILSKNAEGKWKVNRLAIAEGLGVATKKKFGVGVDELNSKIGFMARFKGYDVVYKTKSIYISAAGRTSKGSRCDRGTDKRVIIKAINSALDPSKGNPKYTLGAKSGKGARTIVGIYGYTGDSIRQIPGGATKSHSNKEVRINAFQLCTEEEILFRYFDKERKDGKRWFFSSAEAIINSIETIGRKR